MIATTANKSNRASGRSGLCNEAETAAYLHQKPRTIHGWRARLTELVAALVSRSKSVKVDGTLLDLRAETERQELVERIAESQARVAQELAIARRIENAAEVVMEEFYDYSLEGKAGVHADATKISAAVGGSNKKVSKRIYRFKGQLPP
jgi:hypothetical protein